MIRHFVILFFLTTLTACGGSNDNYSGSYVGGDETALLQLHIVEGDGGQISGNLAVSQLDYAAGKVKLTTRPITGIRNGGQFSLLAHASEWGAADSPLSLQARGSSLVLLEPGNGQTLEMKPMEQDQYRERLAKFAQALNANDVGLLSDE